MDRDDELDDPEPHIAAEFRQAFPTWAALRAEVDARARYPEFGVDRAVHQILGADFLSRLHRNEPWILHGSMSLPPRPPRDFRWPADFQAPDVEGIDQAYVMPRTAFDIDLYAPGIDTRARRAEDPAAAYGAGVEAAVRDACAPADRPSDPAGRGLGGLVQYRPGQLRRSANGQLMGTVIAQPVDPRFRDARPVDDPIAIEVDIKPGSKQRFTSPPEPCLRPLVALALPGFQPVQPRLYPIANQIADKVALLTGPPSTARAVPAGPWHRYKDLFDLHFAIRTCPMSPRLLRDAIADNWNWQRLPDGLPRPYRLYAQPPLQPGEPPIPWNEGIDRLRAAFPQLARYPSFDAMAAEVGAYVDAVTATPTRSPAADLQPLRALESPAGPDLVPS